MTQAQTSADMVQAYAAGNMTLKTLQFADGSQQSTAAVGRNRIINGDCRVVQRGGATISTPSTSYGGPDRFFGQIGGAPGGSFTHTATTITYGGVVRPAIYQQVVTPLNTLATNNYWLGIAQVIEGYNCYDLVGQPATISFIFQTNVAGIYSVSLRDGTAVNSYVTTFNAVAGTPQRVVIQVPTLPTNLNIPASNANGMSICIGALNNQTYNTSTVNQWIAGNYLTGPNPTNWGAAANNYIAMTDLQFETGNTPNPIFERRSYAQEWQNCCRYFNSVICNDAILTGQTNCPTFTWKLPATMRGQPALTSNITMANMVQASPAANQWAALLQGIAWLTVSSGTPVMSWQPTSPDMIQMYITGATFNIMASLFSVGSGIYLYASAEL